MRHTTESENSEEKEDELPKYQTWPVSKSDTRPVERGAVGGNPALSFLRIVLWLLPSIVVPTVVFCILFVANAINTYALNGIICFVLSTCAVAAIGYFDLRIALQQKGLELEREKNKVTGRIVIFVICQIFIIPAILFTLLYGYCIVTDSGFH